VGKGMRENNFNNSLVSELLSRVCCLDLGTRT